MDLEALKDLYARAVVERSRADRISLAAANAEVVKEMKAHAFLYGPGMLNRIEEEG